MGNDDILNDDNEHVVLLVKRVHDGHVCPKNFMRKTRNRYTCIHGYIVVEWTLTAYSKLHYHGASHVGDRGKCAPPQ